jgi:hypothetical protein
MKLTAFASLTLLIGSAITAHAQESIIVELPWRYVLGGHAGGKWLGSGQAGKKIKKGTELRLYTLKGEKGKITANKAEPEQEVCNDVWLATLNKEMDSDAIGIAASWNAMPREVKSGDLKQDAYVKAVSDVLTAKGIKKPVVKITQHLRVDLDGDGNEEVLIAATNYPNAEGEGSAPQEATAGNYSFVALRRVQDGKVTTQVLAGEFHPNAPSQDSSPPNVHEVGGVMDLDGDGKMEIILNWQYYEGGGTTAWKVGAKQAARVLEISCGV